MTSDIQHNQNEIVSKYSHHTWIYALQMGRLKENIAAPLETIVQEKATDHQTTELFRAQLKSLLQIFNKEINKTNLSSWTWPNSQSSLNQVLLEASYSFSFMGVAPFFSGFPIKPQQPSPGSCSL